ncbi:MAG: hypothetical protein MRJ68_09245 [Nitrospira sp.]|nr:hypothetical protein [Nitrospira sp.]
MALPSGKRVIIVATNKTLSNEHYYNRLWIAIKNLSAIHGISRRQWVDLCIACFRDTYGSMEFRWPNGVPYEPPDWDVWFPDGEARWLSYYLAGSNGCPKSRSHLYGRLRVFDLVIRVRWPNIAKGIQA